MIKLWVDDVREAPRGYKRVKSVQEGKAYCTQKYSNGKIRISEISLDSDAGRFANDGGNYIELLNWLETMQHLEDWDLSETVFKFHSQDGHDVQDMKRVCERNNWRIR